MGGGNYMNKRGTEKETKKEIGKRKRNEESKQ